MYKAVVFDMDGVIIDSEPLWEKAEKLFIEGFGMDYNPEYRDKIVGLNQNDSANLIKNSFDLEISVDRIINQRIDILIELYEKELKLIDGILKIINECEKNNLSIGLASSSPSKLIEYVLDKFGLQGRFKAVISGECTNAGKPDPEIYIKASEQLSVAPSECIAIEDSVNGVNSAKSAGYFCIAVPDKRIGINLYESADIIFENVADIKIEDLI